MNNIALLNLNVNLWIEIATYLPIKDMNLITISIKKLALKFLGEAPFKASLNISAKCFSPLSSIPFITFTLIRRNQMTYHDYAVWFYAVSNRLIDLHDKMSFGYLLGLGKKYKNNMSLMEKRDLDFFNFFTSKITHLDWRVDCCYEHHPCRKFISGHDLYHGGFVDMHGQTPLNPVVLGKMLNRFDKIKTLTLRVFPLSGYVDECNYAFKQKIHLSNVKFFIHNEYSGSWAVNWMDNCYKSVKGPANLTGKVVNYDIPEYKKTLKDLREQMNQPPNSIQDYIVSGTNLVSLKNFLCEKATSLLDAAESYKKVIELMNRGAEPFTWERP